MIPSQAPSAASRTQPDRRRPRQQHYRAAFTRPAPYAPVDPYGQQRAQAHQAPAHPQGQAYAHALPHNPAIPMAPQPMAPRARRYTEEEEEEEGGEGLDDDGDDGDDDDREGDRRGSGAGNADDGDWLPGAAPSHGPQSGQSKSARPRDVGDAGDAGEVRTKFPVARIKRIMQADEEVGKVAQVTPVVVSKALEMFMVALVTNAAAEAKARSSKRVSAAHLKQAILDESQFDFLQDIVSRVADAPAAAASDRADATGDEPADGRKRRASRKRRKESDEF